MKLGDTLYSGNQPAYGLFSLSEMYMGERRARPLRDCLWTLFYNYADSNIAESIS